MRIFWFAALAVVPVWGCRSPTSATEDSFTLERVGGEGQHGLAGEFLRDPLSVRVIQGGRVAAGVTVRFSTSTGVPSPETVRSDSDGYARTQWQTGPGDRGPVRLVATAHRSDDTASSTFTAYAVDPALADILIARGRAPGTSATVIAYDDQGYLNATLISFGPEQVSHRVVPFEPAEDWDAIVGFAEGHPPALRRGIAWSAEADTVDLEFGPPIVIPIAIWVLVPPFGGVAAAARLHVSQASALWGKFGLRFAVGDQDVIDATDHPDAQKFDAPMPPCAGSLTTTIGTIPGRLNLYYVGDIIGANGYACGGYITMTASRSRGDLVAHELGHEFGLGHAESPENVMYRIAGSQLTEGQAFLAHFHSGSVINTLFQSHPAGQTRDCHAAIPGPGIQLRSLCLPVEFRIPPTQPGAPVVSRH